jgi:predicted phage-related endonuclease
MTPVSMSVELTALSALPKGIERYPVGTRAEWLRMRERDVTASAAGALVGEHDYETEYGLWAKKSGKAEPEAETKRMWLGTRREPIMAELIALEKPDWQLLYPVGAYYRDPKVRLGCTPDLFAIDPARPGFGNVQIKTTDTFIFKQKWKDGDTVVPPYGVGIQALIEATLTGASWSAVAVGVGYDADLYIEDVPLHPKMMTHLGAKSLEFWRRVEENDPPPVNPERDADTIKALYANADEGATIDLSGDNRIMEIIAQRDALKAREADGSAAVKTRKAIDAEIILKLGDAAYGRLGDGRLICAKTIRTKGYTVEPSSYRSVTIKEDKLRKFA